MIVNVYLHHSPTTNDHVLCVKITVDIMFDPTYISVPLFQSYVMFAALRNVCSSFTERNVNFSSQFKCFSSHPTKIRMIQVILPTKAL